ncbi:MAG TPA: hypothetical protein VJ247_04610 [Gaiella sp.]|jgi:hypothetical protein|nr:hypothetical protein [Gaiella sp.]
MTPKKGAKRTIVARATVEGMGVTVEPSQPQRVPGEVPESVSTEIGRTLYERSNQARASIKAVAELVNQLRKESSNAAREGLVDGEVPANVALAYRHLEDASMRLGKALQALDGGVSVYDAATTIGAPAPALPTCGRCGIGHPAHPLRRFQVLRGDAVVPMDLCQRCASEQEGVIR